MTSKLKERDDKSKSRCSLPTGPFKWERMMHLPSKKYCKSRMMTESVVNSELSKKKKKKRRDGSSSQRKDKASKFLLSHDDRVGRCTFYFSLIEVLVFVFYLKERDLVFFLKIKVLSHRICLPMTTEKNKRKKCKRHFIMNLRKDDKR